MSDFWSFLWLVIWIFVFVAYLMILFQIIGDLFRDHELSGWWKALWIIFLVIFPFLTALVYIIARGRGMTQRSMAAARQAKSDTDAYIRQVAAKSATDQISDAKALLDNGTITQDEFQHLKTKALAG